MFDFDADGHAEFLLRTESNTLQDRQSGIEHESYRIDQLVTYSDARIEPYQPAEKVLNGSRLIDMRDVDNDGRPDLLFAFKALEGGEPPYRVAHSLTDGTFAKDAVASAAEREQCSSAPARVLPVAKSDGRVDFTGTSTAFVCAILAGEKPSEVHQRLKQGCLKKDCVALGSWAQGVVRQGLK